MAEKNRNFYYKIKKCQKKENQKSLKTTKFLYFLKFFSLLRPVLFKKKYRKAASKFEIDFKGN